jgi:hypothetical protein
MTWIKARTPRTQTITRTETGSEQGPKNDGLDQGQDSQYLDRHQNRDRIRTRTRKWWPGSRPGHPGPGQSPEQRPDQNKDQKMLVWFKARIPRTGKITRTETASEQGPENDGLDQSQDHQEEDKYQEIPRRRLGTRTETGSILMTRLTVIRPGFL